MTTSAQDATFLRSCWLSPARAATCCMRRVRAGPAALHASPGVTCGSNPPPRTHSVNRPPSFLVLHVTPAGLFAGTYLTRSPVWRFIVPW